MDLPKRFEVGPIFVQGGAFKAKLANDSYPRFYFVLNRKVEDDGPVVLLTSTTTELDQHTRSCSGDDVHVHLSPDEYGGFTKKCFICCDRAFTAMKAGELKESLVNKKAQFELLDSLPDEVVKKIVTAIEKSRVMPLRFKNLVLDDPNDEGAS